MTYRLQDFWTNIGHILEGIIWQTLTAGILYYGWDVPLAHGLWEGFLVASIYFYGREVAQLEKKVAGPGNSVLGLWYMVLFPYYWWWKKGNLDGFLDFVFPVAGTLALYMWFS